MSIEVQRAARRLLYLIDELDHPTKDDLVKTDLSGDPALVGQGLARLKRRGLAEKYRPPGWPPSKPGAWQLTPAAQLALEEKRWLQLEWERDHANGRLDVEG